MRLQFWGILGLVLVATVTPVASVAQEISFSLAGGENSLTSRSIQLLVLITLLSIAPGLAIMVTCFPFIVTVLSILRQAIGLQQSPPNLLIVSLALFLSYFVMEPVFSTAWENGISPLLNETLTIEEAFPRTLEPFRIFMAARLDNETFQTMAALRPDGDTIVAGPDAPLSVLIPSFLLSEIARAFQVGFWFFFPF